MNRYETTSEAYAGSLREVRDRPDYRCAPRGQAIRESLNWQFTVLSPSSDPIKTLSEARNKVIAAYTREEFMLYASQERRASEFAKVAPFWRTIANPDGTVNSAYGYLIWDKASCGRSKFAKHGPQTPWDWAKSSLMKDPDTRQAILRFALPNHLWHGNKDQVCTMHGVFHIRAGALHLSMNMRSNDIVNGLVYDMPWFCGLIPTMCVELRQHYPTLKVGTYTHFAHSAYIYDRDLPLVKEMFGEV